MKKEDELKNELLQGFYKVIKAYGIENNAIGLAKELTLCAFDFYDSRMKKNSKKVIK